VLGSDDLLYGTTSVGSLFTANTGGTVFSIGADGSSFRILHNFAPFSTFNVVSDPDQRRRRAAGNGTGRG